jgi:ATP-dependent exoDNAse (exonuclease V) alpha subunit
VVLALPNPVEAIGEGLGTAASKAAESAFEFFMTRLATALANAATKVVAEVLAYLDTSSTVSLDQGWWAGPRAREHLAGGGGLRRGAAGAVLAGGDRPGSHPR